MFNAELSPGWSVWRGPRSQIEGGGGGGGGGAEGRGAGGSGGEGEKKLYLSLHCHHQSALRWAATRVNLMFH